MHTQSSEPGGRPLEDLLSQAFSAFQSGQLGVCTQRCEEILAFDPENHHALQLLALVARNRGDLQHAESLLRQALSGRANDARLLNTLGVVLAELGRTTDAVACYEQSVALEPGYARGHSNLGNALVRLGKHQEALAAHGRAIELDPKNGEFHFNRANALRTSGQAAKAVESYETCIALDARFLPAHTNVAALLAQQGRIAEAEQANNRALAINPGSFEGYNNRGSFLMMQGRLDEAEAAYRTAMELNPQNAETHHNLGALLRAQGKVRDAASALDRALDLNPNHIGALILRADDFMDRGDWAKTLVLYERAHRADPTDLAALSSLVHLYQKICAWDAFDQATARLDTMAKIGGTVQFPAEPPHLNVSRVDDPARNLEVARAWSCAIERRMAAERTSLNFSPARAARKRLTIGYLSGDFRNHPTSHLVRGLFAAHDRNHLRIHAYSYGPDDDSFYRRSIASDCDCFVGIQSMTHAAAAQRIYDNGVDILVDLAGHTKDNRLEICALRPAPVQASYLGFPGGTGASFMDYLLTDQAVTPKDQAGHYAEALVLLPHSYQVNDRDQAIDDRPATRAQYGLREDAFVFVCFNSTYKIDPVMFACWMRILGAVPESQFWLFEQPAGLASENLKREAGARGIDPERLIFANRVSKSTHLSRLKLADLALDTRICNGHTTTSDALWAGVPVVALRGRHFASRVSASLLCAVGLPELIVDDLTAYETLAIDLAQTPGRLQDVRARLWRQRISEPLFDTRRFARYLESAYRAIWETYSAGHAPRQIEVMP